MKRKGENVSFYSVKENRVTDVMSPFCFFIPTQPSFIISTYCSRPLQINEKM